ncbi:DNA topoisomerase IB [Spirillospora sp. NPDC047279]|uniref:DNA topoisomerase IB n=1 Tax=Spirillospora sp. NPDC047279 TaxID=3155478 RepID=UPI00340A94B2
MKSSGLQRSDPEGPGITRRRRGQGFSYATPGGEPLRDKAELARIKALVIPPAWREVWISPSPDGHIQAVGTDAAGRRQYLYHDAWRERRDADKHERMVAFAAALPRIRERVAADLRQRGFTRERVLAAAVRLIDLGFFRLGGRAYAEENGTFGLSTVRREHVRCSGSEVTFEYPAKGSRLRERAIAEKSVCAVVRGLKRRSDESAELLAYRDGKSWHNVRAEEVNDYLRDISGDEFTAKDFRTWHATVLAAVALAVSAPPPESRPARDRAVRRAVQEVADLLGNTPAVARDAYIDPQIIDLFEQGVTIARTLPRLGEDSEYGELATQGATEEAVRRLLQR